MNNLNKQIKKHRQEIKSERMDMSFGEIINMYKDKEIIISPEYQRAFRWDPQRQTDFIESVLLGIPFPSIFVATNEDGKWELIDGLQRISTILSFFGELKTEDGKDFPKNNLVLEKGSLIKDLASLTIDTLPLEYKLQIKRTPCRIEIILKESDFKMRYELFKRLNTGGEGLSRQEIRNCIFRGLDNTFNDLIRRLSKNLVFNDIVNISTAAKEKMYYEELVLRFLALKNCGTRYSQSNIQDFMDEYMKEQSEKPSINQIFDDEQIFVRIVNFLSKLDGDIFKLARQGFATSMYDSLMLSTVEVVDKLDSLDTYVISKRIDELKNDNRFNQYVGSASSNPTSITNKLKFAKEVLYEIE